MHTGEVKKSLEIHNTISAGHHHRCHRTKSTVNYLILNKRGAEFLNLNGDDHMRNDCCVVPVSLGMCPPTVCSMCRRASVSAIPAC